MPILAVLDEATFSALPDESTIGKDSYIKDEKKGTYALAMDGAEAGKLALPLQTQFENKKKELTATHAEKNDALAKLAVYESLGKPPDEIKSILETGKTADVTEVEQKYTAQINSLKSEHQRLFDAAKAESASALEQAEQAKANLASTMKRTTVAEVKGKFNGTKLADDFLNARIRVMFDPELERYVERVIDPSTGEIAYKGTQFMTPDQLMEEAKADKDYEGMFVAGSVRGSEASARQKASLSNGFIKNDDWDSIAANLEDVASGKLKVV